MVHPSDAAARLLSSSIFFFSVHLRIQKPFSNKYLRNGQRDNLGTESMGDQRVNAK